MIVVFHRCTLVRSGGLARQPRATQHQHQPNSQTLSTIEIFLKTITWAYMIFVNKKSATTVFEAKKICQQTRISRQAHIIHIW